MKLLSSSQKKEILKQFNKQFGIEKLPYLIVQLGREKYRFYSGNLSKEELKNLDRKVRIENIGLYCAKEFGGCIRLTIDGVHVLKNEIKKNVIEVNDEQTNQWFKGNDIEIFEKPKIQNSQRRTLMEFSSEIVGYFKSHIKIKDERSFFVLKNEKDFIGCGKSTDERIINSVPKERRIKS